MILYLNNNKPNIVAPTHTKAPLPRPTRQHCSPPRHKLHRGTIRSIAAAPLGLQPQAAVRMSSKHVEVK